MNGEPLVTKTQMIEDARRAGFGQSRLLAKTFTNYQQVGLLGSYAEKAKRRGGDGLWHPVQELIWLSMLRSRKAGMSIARCTALPVSIWLCGAEGVSFEQAQRAWATWSNSRLDFGTESERRSRVRQEINQIVSYTATEGTRAGQRRALRDSLDRFLDGLDVSRDTFVASVLGCLSPEEPATPNQRAVAANAFECLSLRFLAISKRHALLRSTTDVVAFWEWARAVYQHSLRYAAEHGPEIVALPDVGRLFYQQTLGEVMLTAPADLATTFGIGIANQVWGRPLGVASEPPTMAAFVDDTSSGGP